MKGLLTLLSDLLNVAVTALMILGSLSILAQLNAELTFLIVLVPVAVLVLVRLRRHRILPATTAPQSRTPEARLAPD